MKRSDFRRTERKGRRVSAKHFIVYARKNPFDSSRLGLTVSRKVGNAVVRNRYKRRVREIFRRNKADIARGYDYVVIVRRPRDEKEPAFATLCDELLQLFEKATRTKDP